MNETLLILVNDCEPFAVCDDTEKIDAKITKARELADLGFYDLSYQIEKEYAPKIKLEKIARFSYRRITREKIEKFLQRKVDLYNQENEVPKPTINKIKSPNDTRLFAYAEWMEARQRNTGTAWQLPQHLFEYQMSHEFDLNFRHLLTPATSGQQIISRENNLIICARTCHYFGGGPVGKFVWNETKIDKYKGIPPANVLETLREHKARNLFDYFTIATVNEVKDPLLLGRIDACDDRFFIAQWGDDVSLDDVV